LSRNSKTKTRTKRDKGHKNEIQVTLGAIRDGASAPIPFSQLVEVLAVTFAIAVSIVTNRTVKLRGFDAHAEVDLREPLSAKLASSNG